MKKAEFYVENTKPGSGDPVVTLRLDVVEDSVYLRARVDNGEEYCILFFDGGTWRSNNYIPAELCEFFQTHGVENYLTVVNGGSSR